MKPKTIALSILALCLAGCTTAQQAQFNADVKVIAPYVIPVADAALAASGNAGAIPVFNALSGMAYQAWLGNQPATGAPQTPAGAAIATAAMGQLPASLTTNQQAAALSQAATIVQAKLPTTPSARIDVSHMQLSALQ